MAVVLVDDGVSFSAGDQVPVDGEGRDERDRERDGEASPEKQVAEPRVHRARDHDDDEVVYDLHDRDRKRVGGEGERQHRAECHARPQEWQHRQPVAEEESQHYRERDRGEVAPPERTPDHDPEHLADGTSRQAMQRCAECGPVEWTFQEGHRGSLPYEWLEFIDYLPDTIARATVPSGRSRVSER